MEPEPDENPNRQEVIATLNPAYFALVMATGIVSIASHLLEMLLLSQVLFGINVISFVILTIGSMIRLVCFPRALVNDLTNHTRGVGFFTTVAACGVLGVQFLTIVNLPAISIALWIAGVVLWFVLTYAIFTSLTVKAIKPSLIEGIHGGWLVSVVAAQSVALLGAMLSDQFGDYGEVVNFFSLSMWLGGGKLYIWIISLIFYRYSFFTMSASDMTPPYWINMGAMAISTLAGVSLIPLADNSLVLGQVLPFIKGFSLLFWATATWWIPMMVVLGVWRHVYMRTPFVYDPQYWSMVFPLGMYTVCTYRLALELELDFLVIVPQFFVYIAVAAWALTFFAMLFSLSAARRAN